MDVFRLRLNCVDHYQAVASKFDPPIFGSSGSTQQRDGPKVPVVRVFGATETGQKVCAHIHGALPYLYVEYRGPLEQHAVDTYVQQLRASIDHALALSYRKGLYDNKSVYVGHITLVKGIPFFGYHVGYRYYLKIYMLNPLNMTRFADLLHQGAIVKQVFQPFEAHLQYLLQWMCDFNLYGCAYIECSKVKFRHPVPDYHEINSKMHKWHDRSIPLDLISDPDTFQRQSHCSIEVDICVQDILNRLELRQRKLHQDFVESLTAFDPQEKLVNSLAGLWKDETKRRKMRMGINDPSSSPFPPEVLVSMSADSRDAGDGGWIHEEEFREKIKDLVDQEVRNSENMGLTLDDFAKPDEKEISIKTVSESVEDLFPENLHGSFSDAQNTSQSCATDGDVVAAEAQVDAEMIPKFDPDDFPYDSDEDTARDIAITPGNTDCQAADIYTTADGSTNKDVMKTEATIGQHYSQSDSFSVDLPSAEFLKLAPSEILNGSVDINSRPLKRRKVLLEDADEATETEHWRQKRSASIHIHNAVDYDQTSTLPRPSVHEPELEKRNNMLERQPLDANIEDGHADEGRPRSQHVAFEQVEHSGFQPNDLRSKKFGETMPDCAAFGTSQSSQGSIKAQGINGNSPLTFPVVKDPRDPGTISSLSQREGLSSSHKNGRHVKRLPANNLNASSLKSQSEAKTPSEGMKILSESTPEWPNSVYSSQTMKMIQHLDLAFEVCTTGKNVFFARAPPSAEFVLSTMLENDLPQVIYQDAYYSNDKDVPERSRDYAGREFKLESTTVPYLPLFNATGKSPASFGQKPRTVLDRPKEDLIYRRRSQMCNLLNWEIGALPPTRAEVEEWLAFETAPSEPMIEVEMDHTPVWEVQYDKIKLRSNLSQVSGPTQKYNHGFKFAQKAKSTSVRHETQYMSTMSLEVHINTRGKLNPNPEYDEISCIFWCLNSDDDDHTSRLHNCVGILALSPERGLAKQIARHAKVKVEEEDNELDLLNRMVDIVRELDPDILTGYEVHNSSWGYLIERARLKYEYDLCDEFSRTRSQSHGRFGKDADRWGFNTTSTIRVTGRHMINIWRAMRSELNLLQYTMENVVFHLLHERIPHYTHLNLTEWYKNGKPRDLAKVIDYYTSRVQLDLDVLDANELIPRTSEQARLIGVDFFSVFSRGSQFKVESIMFRIAKPENFLLVSPSRKQVGHQNALECLPLVMEPQSDFYNSPLLVLDFQSLYPSIMIAYNYCYSTCLGRIVNWRGQNKLGFADFKRQPGLLGLVENSINVAPNGIMYVKPEMRKSLLAKMLGEILETRVMVKSGMRVDKDDRTLQQLLNNRQLALKLLANVTYGYTSASFSGRMPCAEIADSIVQTARETLEKAIAFIHSVTRWGAEVVYGDTDSLFVYLKGRTKDQAFDIGNEIAKAVTDLNPRPVKLKFEKVYFPSVLLAKKRYVGFKYESKTQKEPEFDAKGIETVRRDGIPAEQKIEEKALKTLFRTADLTQVKHYFQQEATKIMLGRVSIQDFCFAKEVRLGTYSDKGPPPPGALVATKRMLEDPRLEPQYGERVPYVVVSGAPGMPLYKRTVSPEELLQSQGGMELDAEYYISKTIIPPLERIFNLVGANVRLWYDEMPKIYRIRETYAQSAAPADRAVANQSQRKTMETYMKSSSCLVCRSKLPQPPSFSTSPTLPLCNSCVTDSSASLHTLMLRLSINQRRSAQIEAVCRSCAALASADQVSCDSKDCPVFYSRVKARSKEASLRGIVGSVRGHLEEERCSLEW